MTYHTEGKNYRATEDLDIVDIAKLMRADLKAAQADGTIPAGSKISVRGRRYSGGQSIDICVEVPFWTRVPEGETDAARGLGHKWPWLVRRAALILERMEAIHAAYNFDNSDGMTDYFHTRYYGDVSLEPLKGTAEDATAPAMPALVAAAVDPQVEMLTVVGAFECA